MRDLSFSTLWDGYESNAAAKAARDAKYKELKQQGIKTRRWILKGQCKQYESFGVPDGRICDVYYLSFVGVP
jgi:muconolactone delta-isomerase